MNPLGRVVRKPVFGITQTGKKKKKKVDTGECIK